MKTSAPVDFENPFAENAPFPIPDACPPPNAPGGVSAAEIST
jgi:hypothetical protein